MWDWDSPSVRTNLLSQQLDVHRRVVMASRCPPGDSGTVEALDKLPEDPAWEARELEAATGLAAQLPCPE